MGGKSNITDWACADIFIGSSNVYKTADEVYLHF